MSSVGLWSSPGGISLSKEVGVPALGSKGPDSPGKVLVSVDPVNIPLIGRNAIYFSLDTPLVFS